MEKTKKNGWKRIIALVCAAAVVLFLAVMPLLAKSRKEADGPKASILSGKVEAGSIQQSLIGGGTLMQQDAQSVTVPENVKLTEFLVTNGEAVSKGDAIARVDRVSVMEAISQVQETLEHLSEEIRKVSDQTLSGKVTAQASGTVKRIYAQSGDSVRTVMLEHGALAVLSLDGRMSVTVQTEEKLAAGEAVTVTFPDESTAIGAVESNLAGKVKVLLADDGYTPGDTVTLHAGQTALGTGTLEINSPWHATAIAGTVDKIKISVGKTVDAGDTLLTLSDTGHTAAYQQLVDQRMQYEQMMLQLFGLYQTQLLCAPCDGMVSGIDKNSAQLLKTSLLANAPNGDDESLYVNYIGQVAAVAQNGWAVLRNPVPMPVEDYKDLSGVNTEPATMTELAFYDPVNTAAPLYELSEGQWIQGELASVQAGDVLLFAGDAEGNFVWLVRIKKAQTQVQPDTPSGDTQQKPGNQQQNQNTAQRPGGSGSVSQQQAPQKQFTLYSLSTADIAAVTPQSTMTLQIAVDELDILRLQVGSLADITVDALTGAVFEGTVTDIGNTGSSNGGSSKFTVELTLERSENMLSGMNATATIPLENEEDVLTVPLAALVEQGTKTVIYTGYDEKSETLTQPVEVRLGASDGENAQLLAGLNQGDTYYYAYYDTLEISYTPDFGGSRGFGR